jgi:hypothetical protein
MKQILHIFKKDARHFWLEILISLSLTAAFALIYPRQWSSFSYGLGAVGGLPIVAGDEAQLLASLLVILVPVGWWILVTRVVHDESLVGDRQFWVTRPYEWKRLLAAKVLFLLAFLYVPIFIAQCVLLKAGGFHPFSYLPGLLFNLLLITIILVLPLVSLATVTSSFARTTLTLLAVILGMVVMATLPSIFNTSSVSAPYGNRISLPLILGLCSGAVLVQYAARRVWLSRFLLLAIPVLIGIAGIASPDAALIRQAYPRPTGSPLQIALDTELVEHGTARPARSSKLVVLNIPLKVSGIEEGRAVQSDDVRISIEAQNGLHWDSPWQSTYGRNYLPGTQASGVEAIVNRAFYDQVKSSPVTIHLTFALTELRAGQSTGIPLATGNFVVPGVGVCSPDVTWDSLFITGISCLSALRQPELNYVTVLWSNTRCSSVQPPAKGVQGAGWAGTLENDPARFGITSVWRTPLSLSNNGIENRFVTPENRHLCPGTPITFTRYSLVGRTQADLTIANFNLPSYSPDNLNQ